MKPKLLSVKPEFSIVSVLFIAEEVMAADMLDLIIC